MHVYTSRLRLLVLRSTVSATTRTLIVSLLLSDFNDQLDTHSFGVVYVCKAAASILRAQASGHIFQVSSLGGRVGVVGLSLYQSAE
jgi:NAD(P)-dependent dehydrogenase (short-subunit alcohol dehydrogenase family)